MYASEDVVDISNSYGASGLKLPPLSPGKAGARPLWRARPARKRSSRARSADPPRAADGPPTPGRALHRPWKLGWLRLSRPFARSRRVRGAPASTFTARQTKNMLPGEEFITNSQEIVEYYVRNGLGAPIKVFYCVDAPVTDDSYTPYDLAVVPKEHVENKDVEHYTVTSSGVVHIPWCAERVHPARRVDARRLRLHPAASDALLQVLPRAQDVQVLAWERAAQDVCPRSRQD